MAVDIRGTEIERIEMIYDGPQKHAAYFHALLRSFYPGATVKVYGSGEIEGKKADEQEGALTLLYNAGADGALKLTAKDNDGSVIFERKAGKATDGQALNEKEKEERLKHFVYECLCEMTGRHLPWGSLMGVRPTKLAGKWLGEVMRKSEGASLRAEIIDRYRRRYDVSEKKAGIATDIALREYALMESLDLQKGFSLYVGVPFCPTRCLYCSFTSNSMASCRQLVGPTLEAMLREIEDAGNEMSGRKPCSVYFGGGTPTALDADDLKRLMDKVAESFDLSEVKEYTVEAGRADSITREKLKVIKEGGAGRISVNPQTMHEQTLALIGRKASPAQVEEAFLLAREEGFSHINMDLILGLPGENTQMVEDTLRKVESLGPDSMTVHSLAIKRGSDLHRRMIEQGVDLSWDTGTAMEKAYESAERQGLLPYYLYRQKNMTGNLENVGFAKDGKFGIYNILVMEEVQDVVAIGPGAISKHVKYLPGGSVQIARSENVRELSEYVDRQEEMLARKRELFEGLVLQ
ncbi:MAG: coproporphyrinogen dehydrogenase HemZ [Lachnospiraceae bacterium]|nr:coproporphyrinogen dehydrogenase HemZ [Lachnospiraceae bacterium]